MIIIVITPNCDASDCDYDCDEATWHLEGKSRGHFEVVNH